MSIKTLVVPTFALLITLSAGTAVAQLRDDHQTRIVQFKHHDLLTEAGRAQIDNRIKRAADAVCSVPNPSGPLIRRTSKACYDQALTDARRQLADRVARAGARVQVATIATDKTLP